MDFGRIVTRVRAALGIRGSVAQTGDRRAFFSGVGGAVMGGPFVAGVGPWALSSIRDMSGAIADWRVEIDASLPPYNADYTGTVSAAAAFNDAAAAAKAAGGKLIAKRGTYKIDSLVTIQCDADLSGCQFVANGSTLAKVLRVGSGTSTPTFGITVRLPSVTNSAKTGAGWSGFDTSIGVELATLYQSFVHVAEIRGFGVNLQMGGYGAGCVYNEIALSILARGKINLLLQPGDSSGWVNDNTIIGGRFFHASESGTSISGVDQIRLSRGSAGDTGLPNNNVFLKPCLEGDEPEYHLNVQGAFNHFISPRLEVSAGQTARVRFYSNTADETQANLITGGYESGITYTFVGTAPQNQRIGARSNEARDFSGCGISIVNRSSSSYTRPHIQGFESDQNSFAKDETSTDWIYRLSGAGVAHKTKSATYPRVEMASGVLLLGSGGSAADAYFSGGAGALKSNAIFQPGTDNSYTLGAAGARWSTVYAATGTINTSDERAKQDVRTLDQQEAAVARRIRALLKAYRFKDAVAAKGDKARVHFGVIAQDVMAAFQAEGLDATRYALLCHDVIPPFEGEPERPADIGEDGTVLREAIPAQPPRPGYDQYGIRYEELYAFMIAAL